jgi:hypothetical protein
MLEAEEVKKRISRHLRFWGEKWDGEGAYFSITARDHESAERKGSLRVPSDLENRWFDVDFRVEETMWSLETTHYAGDAVPVAYTHFGPANLSGIIGAGCTLTPETIFFGHVPVIPEWEQVPEFRVEREGRLYLAIHAAASTLADMAEGRFVVGVSDIGSNLDTLTCLRSRSDALADMVTEPERVKDMFKKIFGLWREFYNENRSWVTSRCTYMSATAPFVFDGKWSKVESESAVMISGDMFEEFVFPALQWQVDYLDRAMFGMDGYGLARMADIALKLKGLHSVAWNPTPEFDMESGTLKKNLLAPASIEVCCKVLSAGKKLALQNVHPLQVEKLFDYIKPDGVFMTVQCPSAQEADDFASYVKKWQNFSSLN